MRLALCDLPALLVLVAWGMSCSAPVATRLVPPVKTRPVQEVALSTEAQPTPAVQRMQPPPRGSAAGTRGRGKPLSSEEEKQAGKEHEEEQSSSSQIVGKRFAAYGLHEDEIGSHHEHGVVTLDGINLFVLRTGHPYRTPVERAKATARLLEESLHAGDPLFILGQDGEDPAIYSVSHHGGYPRLIVTITQGDARGYSHRSGYAVSQEELGQWWLGWLEDLVALLFLEQPHTHLPVQRAQEALTVLGQRLRELSPRGPYTHAQVVTAVEALDDETHRASQSLAFSLGVTEKEPRWGDVPH